MIGALMFNTIYEDLHDALSKTVVNLANIHADDDDLGPVVQN